ncbi:MAG: carbohydrate-binding family 9-like protein [Candidatus Latescibacterota bacterium]|nr:carbohydrate-binding family 9-like protein [Candidatus Latescibacterota bacterium]
MNKKEINRTDVPILVDGNLDKPVWRNALKTQRFGHIDGSELGYFDTRASFLWDDDALYAGFWAEDHDIHCTHNERSALVWPENTVELYIAGPGAYYTLAVAPNGNRSEMFFIWKDSYKHGGRYDIPEFDLADKKPMVFGGDSGPHHPRGMRWGFFDWTFPNLQIAIDIDGTLDVRNDIDRSWKVEMALPWDGISRLFDGLMSPIPGTSLSLACARCQMIQHRGQAFPCIWTPEPLPNGDLHDPTNYFSWKLT